MLGRRRHQVCEGHVTVGSVLGMEQVEVEAIAPPHRGAAAVQVHALYGGEGLQGLEDFATTARVYVLLGEAGARGVDLVRDRARGRVERCPPH